MFTGIIESVGKIMSVSNLDSVKGRGLSLWIEANFRNISLGESISVDGVCLTVCKRKKSKKGTSFLVNVSEETLKRTTMENVQPGCDVNLERSLKANSRIGGHFVQGHIDGKGGITGILLQGNSKLYSFSYPTFLGSFIVSKGSIAIDGISLTVVDVIQNIFTVSVLPFTEMNTSLKNKKKGDPVNIETDVLAKIVVKQFRSIGKSDNSLGELYQKKTFSWDDLWKEENIL